MSVIFATALFFECCTMSVAIPMSKSEDGSLEQDAFGSLLSDEAAENSLGSAGAAAVGETGRPKVIVVGDASLWKDLRALYKGLTLYKQRAGENGLILDRRDVFQDPSIAVIRRDTMRCMVGRVYRPCWEV